MEHGPLPQPKISEGGRSAEASLWASAKEEWLPMAPRLRPGFPATHAPCCPRPHQHLHHLYRFISR